MKCESLLAEVRWVPAPSSRYRITSLVRKTKPFQNTYHALNFFYKVTITHYELYLRLYRPYDLSKTATTRRTRPIPVRRDGELPVLRVTVYILHLGRSHEIYQ